MSEAYDVVDRARFSRGSSGDSIYAMVRRALRDRNARGNLLDIGCGTGALIPWVQDVAAPYAGVDVVRYDDFPADTDFHLVNLDDGSVPLPSESADLVIAVETIEHLENPRAFAREMVRLVRPGGWIVITTPNQRSLLSLAALVLKGHFVAFQDSCYPAHITALVATDLRRIAAENGLEDIAIEYSRHGRLPGTARVAPRWLSRLAPRLFSDNLLLAARKPLD